jgi:hypothetical protein
MVSDADLLFALNSAQSDFAEQTFCLFSGTADTITTTVNDPWVDKPAKTLSVRALVRSDGSYIRPVTTVEMDYGHFSSSGLAVKQDTWRALTGNPKFAVTDQSKTKLRLVPMPTTVDTLTVEAYMLPADITATASPEIPEEYHSDLLAGAASILYGSQNVEIFDANSSQEWQAKWFGAIEKAKDQLDTARRVVVRNFKLPRTIEYRNAPVAPPPNQQRSEQ